jgi:hypothetical protein
MMERSTNEYFGAKKAHGRNAFRIISVVEGLAG